MRSSIIFNSIIVLLVLFSCNKPDIDNEIKVFNDVFLELTDEMGILGTTIFPPPPPPPKSSVDSVDNAIGHDSLRYKKLLDEYHDKLERKKSDNSELVLAINDTLSKPIDADFEYVRHQLPSDRYIPILQSINSIDKADRLIDVNDLKNTDNYKLIHTSSLGKLDDIWEKDFDFDFVGFFSLSRIYFDDDQEYGLFYCSYFCGRLCGTGNIICIKKINNQWKIEKTICLWIS